MEERDGYDSLCGGRSGGVDEGVGEEASSSLCMFRSLEETTEQISPIGNNYDTRNNHDIGGTAAGLRRLAARSRVCDKVAFPLNSATAKTTHIPTLRLQPFILLFVFGRTTK